jgi:uncharacterized protein (TIGR02145 family)
MNIKNEIHMKNLLLLIFALVINYQIIYGQEVTIGRQTWMQKNLNVSKYRDGTPIPQVTDPKKWANLTTGAWCYYENKTANETIYGKLYNWYAVAGIHDTDPSTPNKMLAPQGWHVPSDSEWKTLTKFLGVDTSLYFMKKRGETFWERPNKVDTTPTPDKATSDRRDFRALPAGYRSGNGGDFDFVGDGGDWWS